MMDLANPKNQWLVLELKICRAALGLTQQKLADLSGMSLDSMKRLEKSGAEPKHSTINKLRKIFNHLGVKFIFDEKGNSQIMLRPSLVKAINIGKHDEYIKKRIESFEVDKSPELFDEPDSN